MDKTPAPKKALAISTKTLLEGNNAEKFADIFQKAGYHASDKVTAGILKHWSHPKEHYGYVVFTAKTENPQEAVVFPCYSNRSITEKFNNIQYTGPVLESVDDVTEEMVWTLNGYDGREIVDITV